MKSISLTVLLAALLFSCRRPTDQNATNNINQLVKAETEKWKKELLISGEVGGPCLDNIDKWSAQYPERLLRTSKGYLYSSKTVDANEWRR